jgi:hypothetical protein
MVCFWCSYVPFVWTFSTKDTRSVEFTLRCRHQRLDMYNICWALGTAVSISKIGATVVACSINRLEFQSPKIFRYPS